MKGRPLGDTVVLTLRLSAHDRALLARLVDLEAKELAERGVDVSTATVLRQLIRHAAKERGVDLGDEEAHAFHRHAAAQASSNPDVVRRLLVRLADKHRGLAAEVARRFDVEPAQVSKFKNGHEGFPAGKLDALYTFLKARRHGE